MWLCGADAVVTVVGMYGAPNVSAYPTLDISRSMGWNRCLVNAIHRVNLGSTLHVRGHFLLWAKYQLKRVIFHNASQKLARKMNITLHRAARSFSIQRHLRARTAKLIHARMLFDLFRVTTAVSNGAAASIVFVGKVCGL